MKRPKFHPVHDDYYAVVIEDGSWLEYASTDQFWELFEYCDWLEEENIFLRAEVARLEIIEAAYNIQQLEFKIVDK